GNSAHESHAYAAVHRPSSDLSRCQLAGWGGLRRACRARHICSAVQNRTGTHNQNRAANLTMHPAAGKNLGAPPDFDIPENLTGNFDLARLDIGMYRGMSSNDQEIVGENGTCEVPVDAELAPEVKFAIHTSSLVQEAQFMYFFHGFLKT